MSILQSIVIKSNRDQKAATHLVSTKVAASLHETAVRSLQNLLVAADSNEKCTII